MVRAAGRVPRAFGGTVTERRSATDDHVLVHQQRFRSSDRRRFDVLCYWRPDALPKSAQCGHFLPLRSVHRPVFVLVFRRRVRGVESLGARRILGVDPSAAIFQCRLSVNHRAVNRNVGDEWSSAPENSITAALLGGMRPLSRFVGSELCCPL